MEVVFERELINTVQSNIFVKNQNEYREALMSGMTDGDHKLLLFRRQDQDLLNTFVSQT